MHIWAFLIPLFILGMTVALSALANAFKRSVTSVADGIFAGGPERTFNTSNPIISTPLVAGDTIILRTDKQVYALNPETMAVVWQADAVGSPYDTTPPLVAGDFLIVPQDEAPMLAFNVATGEPMWTECFESPIAYEEDCDSSSKRLSVYSLNGNDDVIVITIFKGPTIAYDTSTGTQLWELSSSETFGTPLVYGDSVYQDLKRNQTYSMHRLDMLTGETRWQKQIGGYNNNIAVEGDDLYFVADINSDYEVVALSAADGSMQWQVPVSGVMVYSRNSLTIDGDLLFAAGSALTALDRSTGAVRWRATRFHELQTPTFVGNIVLARDRFFLYAFDRNTGNRLGRLTLDIISGSFGTELNPAVYGDLVLIPVGEKSVAAYRLESP